MSTKKTTFTIAFLSMIFISASFMVAQAYEPLVRLPGLPSTGTINLSQYVVGLYNFLLSIVGIVAVMMLIIGGMKYITAAGNASVIGDAKDTISNAIFGLLLALLSWVIVSTINPDVLFIKNPASSLVGGYTNDLGACGEWDGSVCTCKDGSVPISIVTSENECKVACSDPVSCELTSPTPCAVGSNEPFIKDNVRMCSCIDGNDEVILSDNAPEDAKCNEVCSNPNWAEDEKYHGISHNVAIGNKIYTDPNTGEVSVFGESLESGKAVYFDLTEIKDCKNDIISKALDYDGGGPFLWAFTNEACCEQRITTCLSWGAACFVPLPPPSFGFVIPSCENDTYIDKPAGTLIYKHTYLLSGTKEVWLGITSDGPAGCQSDKFIIEIEVQ